MGKNAPSLMFYVNFGSKSL